MPHKLRLLQKFFKTVFEEGDRDAVDTFFSDATQIDNTAVGLEIDLNDLKELIFLLHDRYENICITIVQHVEDGPNIAAQIRLTWTEKETGTSINIGGHLLASIDQNEKFYRYAGMIDFLSMYEQLGQLPENALMLLLARKKFAPVGDYT